MSQMGERAIMVANGEACPQCLNVYPAPTARAETVTCGTCGFCHCLPRAVDTLARFSTTRCRNTRNGHGSAGALCVLIDPR